MVLRSARVPERPRATLAQHPSITGLGCVCPGRLLIRHGRAPSSTPPERCRPPLPPHRPRACTFHIAAPSPSGNRILALLWLGKAYLPVDGAVRKLEFWFSFGDLNPDLKTFLRLLSAPKIHSMCPLKLFVSASTITPN